VKEVGSGVEDIPDLEVAALQFLGMEISSHNLERIKTNISRAVSHLIS
jgi:hypothetical protein